MEQDPIGLQGGDANLYRYVHNDPTNSTDPSGLVEKTVDVRHLLQKNLNNPAKTPIMFYLSLIINADNSLTIKLKEGPGFDQKARQGGFPFDAVVTGAASGRNKKSQDTDSVQVAVRWLDKCANDVGHDTNAKGPGKRPAGATWTLTGTEAEKNMEATWTAAKRAPDSAVRVDVIVLYTDVIAATGEENDLTLIIGSVTATRKDAKSPWTIDYNSKDVFQPVAERDKDRQVFQKRDSLQQGTDKILKEKTGYELRHRAKGNSEYDTGYDIAIRP